MMQREIHLSLMIFSIIFVFAAGILSGCKDNSTDYNNNNSAGDTTPQANEVWMQNTSFYPKTKTITAGTEITWINKDSFNHTVTSGTPGNPDKLFSSNVIGSGGTYKHTFNTPGTYNYYCSLHQDVMTGIIIVQ